VGRPAVATEVAGFRTLGPPVACVAREGFTARVEQALRHGAPAGTARLEELGWEERCRRFEAVLAGIGARASAS
jgi:hypothetical protein